MKLPLSPLTRAAIISLVLALAPLVASAQAATTYTPTGPINAGGNGFQIFYASNNSNGSSGMITALTNNYDPTSFIWKDIIAAGNGSNTYGPITATQLEKDKSGFVHGNVNTGNRLCQDEDAQLGPNPSGAVSAQGESSMSESNGHWNFAWCLSDSGDGCHNAYSYPSWIYEDGDSSAKDPSGTANFMTSLTCVSHTLPSNTLAADNTTVAANYTVASGAAVTLSYNDTVPRDTVTLTDANGYSDEPSTTCTANFTIPSSGTQTYCAKVGVVGMQGNNCELLLAAPKKGFIAAIQHALGSITTHAVAACTQVYGCTDTEQYQVHPTSGTVTVNPTQTTKYTYSCSNANGTTNASITVNVNAGIDFVPTGALTSSPASPAQGAASQTLSQSFTNQGSAPSTTNANVLFKVAADNTGANWTTAGTTTLPPLAANASSPATITYAFPKSGTWYYSACANTTDSTNYGPPAESSTGNNCSGWTPIKVTTTANLPDYVGLAPTVPADPIVGATVAIPTGMVQNVGTAAATAASQARFRIDTSTGIPGLGNDPYDGNTVNYLTSATAVPALGISSSNNTSGVLTPTQTTWVPSAPGLYKASICANSNGAVTEGDSGNDCGPDTDFTVYAPLSVSCDVTPTTGTTAGYYDWKSTVSGGSGNYTYTWSGDENLSGSGPEIDGKTYTTSGPKNGQLEVQSSDGQDKTVPCAHSASVSAAPTCTSFYADDTSVPYDGSTMLHWACSSSYSSCSGSGGDFSTGGQTTGSAPVTHITSNTDYQLDCDGDVKDVPVTVSSGAAGVPNLSANPVRVAKAGNSTLLTYSAQNVKNCTLSGSDSATPIDSSNGGPSYWGAVHMKTVTVRAKTTYTLSCLDDTGATVNHPVTVTIVPSFLSF